MNRKIILSLVLGLAMGCGPSNPPADGGDAGTQDVVQAQPRSLFNGMYTTTTDVSAQEALVGEVATARMRAGMFQFAEIDAQAGASSPIGRMLSAVDTAYLGTNASSNPNSLERTFRNGLAAGMSATTDDARSVAKQYVEKSLLVALELAMHIELNAAAEHARYGRWAQVREHWDAAALLFTGLEERFRNRSTTMVMGIWGPGTSMITDENLADRTIELLARGPAAIDAMARRTLLETTSALVVYTSKTFYLSGLNYAAQIESRLAMMMGTDVARAEGGTYYQGVLLAFHAQSTTAAANMARTRWTTGPIADLTLLNVIRDSGALYAEMNAQAVADYASASDDDRAITRARLTATVDVLDEALAFAGQDVAMLRQTLVLAGTRSASGDHAGAAALLSEVENAITAVARAGM